MAIGGKTWAIDSMATLEKEKFMGSGFGIRCGDDVFYLDDNYPAVFVGERLTADGNRFAHKASQWDTDCETGNV
jgi:hypothetical protein